MAKSLTLYIETHQYAHSVFNSCTKAQVIGSAGLPDTSHINAALVSKIAIISVPKQRELVNMLFFWEEEVTRLKLLDQEETNIRQAIDGQGENEDLSMALQVVRRKRGMLPSMRKGNGSSRREEVLPDYE